MITQIKMILEFPNAEEMFAPEWAYRLYAGCLKDVSNAYVEKLHGNATTPVSQFLKQENSKIVWTVNLLGEEAERNIKPVLLKKDRYDIPKKIRVREKTVKEIRDVEQLFAMASTLKKHRLDFVTATAFKSRGQYTNLPTIELCLNNLVRRWNDCFPECFIEDEDGQGIETLGKGLFCTQYRLHDCRYTMKGNCIYGFCGHLNIKNNMTGFHKELADALLLFSQYSGIGIKTALGMGGVEHSYVN